MRFLLRTSTGGFSSLTGLAVTLLNPRFDAEEDPHSTIDLLMNHHLGLGELILLDI